MILSVHITHILILVLLLLFLLRKDGVQTLAIMAIHDPETITGIDVMTGIREGETNTTDGAPTTISEGAVRETTTQLYDPLPTHASILPNRSRMPRLINLQLQRLTVPLQRHNPVPKKRRMTQTQSLLGNWKRHLLRGRANRLIL